MIVKRKENHVIKGVIGTYYGECLKIRKKSAIPHGCGLFVSDRKVILGRLFYNQWIKNSKRLILYKNKCILKVKRKIKCRPKKETLLGIEYGEKGKIKKGMFSDKVTDLTKLSDFKKDDSFMGIGMNMPGPINC